VKTSNKNFSVSARLQALWWLNSVLKDGRSINEVLASALQPSDPPKKLAEKADMPFAKQLLFGSLRYFHQIKAILDQLIEKPLKQKDNDIYAILILGIYQLRFLSVPDHAALSESVELTRKIKKSWSSGLVNGILRNYQRQVKNIEQKLGKARTFQFSHPNWMINQLQDDWPEHYQTILKANNQQAPMVIRVNQQKTSSKQYLERLQQQGLAAKCHPLAKDALVLETACDVFKLPGFEQGLVSVQDAAAQLVVDLLDLKPAQNVLDGCAAPGGKTTHILQRQPDVNLTSVEMSSIRIKKIEQTLERLSLKCDLKCADILEIEQWWDGHLFDRILIDVPCSASGVIRRNPDIKIHRKKLDIKPLTEIQANILQSMWSLLKPGGRLVYATCSVFKDENERQIAQFLKNNQASVKRLLIAGESIMSQHGNLGHQIFPDEQQMDGFYLCALEKP